MTEQGMEMELPSEEESGPECGMFTWSCWKSSVGEEKKIRTFRVVCLKAMFEFHVLENNSDIQK